MADEKSGRQRRFQPANARFQPKGRQTTHHRSLMNLTSSVINETTPSTCNTGADRTESKETGFVRRIPKFFRWGGGRKAVPPEPVPKVLSDPPDDASAMCVPTEEGFIGNLGIGHYIASEESTFLNYDAHDENLAPVSRTLSKSMVDLSSITPWSCVPTEPIPIRSSRNPSTTESEADSVSTSSHSDHFAVSLVSHRPRDFVTVHANFHPPIPELIKVLFFTNVPCDTCIVGEDTLTANQDHRSEQRKIIEKHNNPEFVPAWLITENGLIPNISYTVFRTHDYLGDIHKAIRWLENYENQRVKHKKASRRYQSPAGFRFASDLRSRRLIFDTSNFAVSFPNANKKKAIPSDDGVLTEESSGSTHSAVLFSPKEGKFMLKLLSEASRITESMHLNPEGTRGVQSGLNAWIIRSVPINCNSTELSGRMLIPDLERPASGRVHTAQEMKQVFRQESAQVYEIATVTGEMQLVLHEFRFQDMTLYLTSSHLLISSTSPGLQTVYSTQFQHVLPLCQLWCSKITLGGEDSNIQADESQNIIVTEDLTIHAPVSLNSSSLAESEETVSASCSGDERNLSLDKAQVFMLGYPLSDIWCLRFPDKSKMDRWSTYLHDAISYNQRMLIGRTLYIKIMNQVADNQIVYKYHKVYLTTSVKDLKAKALESMNLNKKTTDVNIWVRYNKEANQRELPLLGHESPFLIALFLTVNSDESSAVQTPTSLSEVQGTAVGLSDQHRRRDIAPCELINKLSPLERFLIQLPDTNPLFSRDQVRVDFLIRAKERPLSQTKRHRNHGPMKPSDVKKSHSHFTSTKTQREKCSLLDKTKSTLFLPTEVPKNVRSGGVLRGARSTGSLNASAEQWAIFGRIPEEIWPSAVLPQSLVSLFVVIYYTGVEVEGIFRKTASTSQIQMMRARVDENIDPITPATCPPIVAAGVLKRFFGEIPGHLLIDSSWDDWVHAVQVSAASERSELLEILIKRLPRVNQTLVALLLHLLAHVRDHEAVNRMSTEALGTVWGPNLIEKPHSSPNPEDAKLAYQVVVSLLDRQFTNRMLHESSTLHQEITRHYRTAWEAMNMSTSANLPDDQSSSASRSRSTQESAADQIESIGDNSCASSFRSDSDAAEEIELRKNSPVYITIPFTSFQSRSASPPRETLNRAVLSPSNSSELQRTHYINRHRLLLRSDTALPDQIPPSKVEPLYDVSRQRTRGNARKLVKSTSLQEDEVSVTSRQFQQPPPIPPRCGVTNSPSTCMPEFNRPSRELEDKRQTTAPPVPPKAKPRSRGPLKATPTSSEVTSYLMTSQSNTTVTNDRIRYQSAMSRTSICSLPAALGYETGVADPFLRSLWTSSTTRIPEQQSFRSESSRINHRHIRDRRHGSVERVSFSSQFNHPKPKVIGESISVSPSLKVTRTPLAELPRTEAPGNQSQHANFSTHITASNSGDPCGYTVYRVEGRKYLIHSSPPISQGHQQQAQEQHIETRRKPADNQPRTTVKRRPYSIDRSTINLAREALKPLITANEPCGTSQTLAVLDSIPSVEYPRDGDLVVTDKVGQRRSCVRRISSHASTISSESNTLVSTSTEKVDSIS